MYLLNNADEDWGNSVYSLDLTLKKNNFFFFFFMIGILA